MAPMGRETSDGQTEADLDVWRRPLDVSCPVFLQVWKTVCLTRSTAAAVPISSSYEILQYLHNGGLIFKKSNISGNKPAATKGFAVIPNNNTVCR